MSLYGFHKLIQIRQSQRLELQNKLQNKKDRLILSFLLTFPFSKFVISFNLTEANTDVKQRLQLLGKQLDPMVFSAVESLIDGAIANFKSL